MSGPLGEVLVVLGIAAIAAVAGVAFGILFLAPRISRRIDRSDEEQRGGDD